MKKMGGDALNKFFGVLTRERKLQDPEQTTGYFVSLGGFTETGKQQEIETGDDRVILLDAGGVVDELQRTRVLVRLNEALEVAGRCAENTKLKGAQLDGAELLGHDRGYLWAIYYSQDKRRSHFALVHADGIPLDASIAQEVIEADQKCSGKLQILDYLAPTNPEPNLKKTAESAIDVYLNWLAEECGFIQLDGLPADTDLSATRLKLERLFVPLKVVLDEETQYGPRNIRTEEAAKLDASSDDERSEPQPFGDLLSKEQHIAILAYPGGGKSTLLKRLAIAYAFPERHSEVADRLPERNWMPLLLRCRELRDRASRPILELLADLPLHAAMSDAQQSDFRKFLHESLRDGNAILLVDGLDEIADESERQAFAMNLRTFLAMFPQTALVVTSRMAGFRLVAGVIAGMCTRTRLATLDEDDVHDLCESWHREVIGSSESIIVEANKLAESIWSNSRIRPLAENPLLLTTLLVVKRWIGELPRSRAPLYKEAIRVLIRTWNVEGFAPLDEEETLAQLSYVACAMMEKGSQQVGEKELHHLLESARDELEEELRFTEISAKKFIERIEYRSSLLMQTGHSMIEGNMQPVYEFRHLTFQEYLAARGYVEEQYPGRAEARHLEQILEPKFENESWREVIPLAAVLAGRKADAVVEKLTRACEKLEAPVRGTEQNSLCPDILFTCLLDEVQVKSSTLSAALKQLSRFVYQWRRPGSFRARTKQIARGKFGPIYREQADTGYMGGGPDWQDYTNAVSELVIEDVLSNQNAIISKTLAARISQGLTEGNRTEKIHMAFAACQAAYRASVHGRHTKSPRRIPRRLFDPLMSGLASLLDPHDPPMATAACWALAWIGELSFAKPKPTLLKSLYSVWRQAEPGWPNYFSSWAFASQPLLRRDAFGSDLEECDKWIIEEARSESIGFHWPAPLILAWYRRSPWSDLELVNLIDDRLPSGNPLAAVSHEGQVKSLLRNLGKPGKRVLDRIEKEEHR